MRKASCDEIHPLTQLKALPATGVSRRRGSIAIEKEKVDGGLFSMACHNILLNLKGHYKEALALGLFVGLFGLLYWTVDDFKRGFDSVKAIGTWWGSPLLGMAAGIVSVLLPLVMGVDKGPFLSVSETAAVMSMPSGDRRANDLEKALVWKLVCNMLLFAVHALVAKSWYAILVALLGDEGVSDVGAYIAKATMTDFFFGPCVFFPLLSFSLMWINNAFNFCGFIEKEKVLTTRSFVLTWGVPILVMGFFMFCPLTYLMFSMNENLQVFLQIMFGIFSRILESTFALARDLGEHKELEDIHSPNVGYNTVALELESAESGLRKYDAIAELVNT